MSTRWPWLLFFSFVTTGCVAEQGRSFAAAVDDLGEDEFSPSPPEAPQGPEDAPPADPVGGVRRTLRGTPPPGSVLPGDPSAAWACVTALKPACPDDYFELRTAAGDLLVPLDSAELEALAAAVVDATMQPAPSDPAVLASAVEAALGIGPMVDELEARPTWVTQVEEGIDRGFRRSVLHITDELIGTVRLVVHWPAGDGPHPILLALHGHGTEAVDWPDSYSGLDYVEAGYALASLDSRVLYADSLETQIGVELLRTGTNLMGVHVYEALVAHKVLRSFASVGPIALIGHSAGAGKVDVMAWWIDGFFAVVSDNTLWVDRTEERGRYHEGWVPGLAGWEDALNDLAEAPVPTLMQDYGFPDGSDAVIAFLDQALLSAP